MSDKVDHAIYRQVCEDRDRLRRKVAHLTREIEDYARRLSQATRSAADREQREARRRSWNT